MAFFNLGIEKVTSNNNTTNTAAGFTKTLKGVAEKLDGGHKIRRKNVDDYSNKYDDPQYLINCDMEVARNLKIWAR